MTILDLIKGALISQGYSGLINLEYCCCELCDLSPGDCLSDDCQPGYKHTHRKTGDWIISLSKDAKTDDEIQEILDEL